MSFVAFLVPPKTDYTPEFIRGYLKLSSLKNLSGPYLENVNEKFTCHIKKVLPGNDSTLFQFYYDGNLRLQSKDGIGQVLESDEPDHTKHVTWEFATFFNRSDNGGKMKCHVNWTAGQYKRPGLKSIPTEKVQVICKCTIIYIRPFISTSISGEAYFVSQLTFWGFANI